VSTLQLPRARGPEPFARIVEIPQVEVADLWALDGDDPRQLSGAHSPGVAAADGNLVLMNHGAAVRLMADAQIEFGVEGKTPRPVGVSVESHGTTLTRKAADAARRQPESG